MNILFIHQAFPGQYRHIIRALSRNNEHRVVGLGVNQLTEPIPDNVTYLRYPIVRGNNPTQHEWMLDFDSKLIRGESCAIAASQLKKNGFNPDIICAHPGWGEALFLKDIWPNVPLLCYHEYFYNAFGFDYDFDPEFQGNNDWRSNARLRLKNANPLLMLEASTWNITPTNFQLSTFPKEWHHKFSVIHDGIDTDLASPSSSSSCVRLPDSTTLSRSDKLVTFVNRTVEPYRGCHTFFRAIPRILGDNPDSHIVIVGSTVGVSYGNLPSHGNWIDLFLSEIQGSYDTSRLHITSSLDYSTFIQLLQLSSCHVYLTYPFVLSWSMLEAMSIGVPLVASSTPPVTEVVKDRYNGLLVDFFSADDVASSVVSLLSNNELSLYLGQNSRKLILSDYSVKSCVEKQISLIYNVASS